MAGDDEKMGGAEWEGVPAGTSGSAAPGTEGAGEGQPSGGPAGERPTRRGHEDVGDESGSPGVVGDESTMAVGSERTGDGGREERTEEGAPADAGLGRNARQRPVEPSSPTGPDRTTGPGRAAGEDASTGSAGIGDQSEHGGSESRTSGGG